MFRTLHSVFDPLVRWNVVIIDVSRVRNLSVVVVGDQHWSDTQEATNFSNLAVEVSVRAVTIGLVVAGQCNWHQCEQIQT